MPFYQKEHKEAFKIESELISIPNIKSTQTIFKKATKSVAKSTSLQIGSAIHEMLEGEEQNKELSHFLLKYDLLNEQILLKLIQKSIKIRDSFPSWFEKGILCELEIIQEVTKDEIFKGRIDRLKIASDISICDFKYQKTSAATKEAILQLKSYKIAVSKIYPHKKIKTFILWLKEEVLEEFNIN